MTMFDFWLEMSNKIKSLDFGNNDITSSEVCQLINNMGYNAKNIPSQDNLIFIKGNQGQFYTILNPRLVVRVTKEQLELPWGQEMIREFEGVE